MQTQIASINHDFAAQANTQKYSNAFMCQHDNLKAGKLSESSTNHNLWSNEIGDAPNNNEGKIDLYRLQFFSPAEHVPSEMTMKSLLNPVARLDTTLMNTAHRVELPMICSQKQSELRSRRLRNRSENAKNSLPDKINETILKYSVVTTGGLERPMCALDLFDRGLIPPNVQVQFHPPVMRTSTAPIHDSKECEDKIKISVSDFRVYEHTFNTDGYRRIYGKGAMRTPPGPVSLRSVHSGDDHSTPVAEIHLPKQPPSTPAPNMEDDTLYWLRVECGVFDRRCAAFQDFEEHYSRLWPRISRVMEKLEQLFAKYNITTVVVNGKQLLDLTNRYAENLEAMPKLELVSCVENAKEIVEVINRTTKGEHRRFQGPDRSTEAAILIQAHFRRLHAQKSFMELKRRTAAANIIRAAWLRRNWVKKVRKSLLATRAMQALLSQQRLKTLEQNWDEFTRNDHVFVHIPSVGYSEQMRRSLRDSGELHHMEIRQIARLCEVRGHTTHVVLVTRASIPDELLEYYDQLLGLAGAIRTGEEKDRCSQSTRFRIIVPEAVKRFQSPAAPPLCLSSLLKYSSNALKNIRSFIVGRPAIIVPGVGAHPDDFAVAAELGIPVWTARPQVFHLFARQSTCRRLVKQLSETKSYGAGLLTGKFSTVSRKRANVRGGLPEATGHSQTDGKSSERLQPDRPVLQPPGDYDVYTLDRLHETLATLFTENLPSPLWLLKIDTSPDSFGTALLNLRHLPSFTWALKQRELHGREEWSETWIQEPTYTKILEEVPQLLKKHLELKNRSMYSDKSSFLKAFLSEGGVIEACPPTPEWTSLFVDMVITPSGQVECLASGDRLHAGKLLCELGATVPTSSVDPQWLNAVSTRLAKAMVQKGFVGHFGIDFVTFIHPESDEQILWVTRIRPGYSDTLAMAQLAMFASEARFHIDPVSGTHSLRSRLTARDPAIGTKSDALRYVVTSARLWHSGLTKLQYSTFFQICRSQYIGFNLKDRSGVLLCPMDSCRREYLGMIAISETLEKAIKMCGETLKALHYEISSPQTLTGNNFQCCIKELESVRTLVLGNLKEQRARQNTSSRKKTTDESSRGTCTYSKIHRTQRLEKAIQTADS